jgi:TolB-like protein/class 3 adenylate cyclase
LERRLAAILAADVVGYSRLMGEDETGTLERLKSLRKELVKPKITERKGRIVKLMGDGLLAEFPSVVEAVQCAGDIQDSMNEREADLPDDRRIRLRIGVNLGDIIVEGSDIYGDGVNVAARLEALADPGGICISGSVFDQVKGKVDLGFEDCGEQEVKNIAEPVRVYRVVSDAPAVQGMRSSSTLLPLPDKPSIAVLPFTNMSGDPEQEYFSDGITEDIITELSRFRSLFVIARNSSFHYKGQSPRVQDVGRELGIHYVVEGSVRKAGNRVRITAQLVEAESGNHLWAERYDRDLENIFDVQDEVVQEIAASVPGQLNVAAMERARRRPAESLSAYDCLLRGEWLMFRDFTDRNVIPLFERAVEIDPQCARAYIQLARLHAYSFTQGVSVDEAAQSARTLAEKALEISPSDPSIQAIAAVTYMMMCEHDLAQQHIERAISLNPNDGEVMASAVFVLNYLGDREEALRWNRNHLRHDPVSSDGYRENAVDLYYMARRYEDVIAVFRGWRNPPLHVYAGLAAAYAQNGQPEEAKAALETCLRELPEGFDIAAIFRLQFRQCAKPEDAEHWREGYRKAGLDL